MKTTNKVMAMALLGFFSQCMVTNSLLAGEGKQVRKMAKRAARRGLDFFVHSGVKSEDLNKQIQDMHQTRDYQRVSEELPLIIFKRDEEKA